MFELDLLSLINLAVLIYVLRCCARMTRCCSRVSSWIVRHEPWLADHHKRNGKLEQAVCRLEVYAYRDSIDPSLAPAAADRFCSKPNTAPQGWGGDEPPDGF